MKSFFFGIFAFALISFGFTVSFSQKGGADDVAAQAASVSEFEVNGLKVLLKKRPSAPTFAAGLFFRGGARNITAETAGIENLTLNAAIEAGRKFPKREVRRILASGGSSLSAAAGIDYSAVSFAGTRENFAGIWELFTDVITNPAFAAEDVERVRQQIIAGLREEEISPDGALQSFQDRVVYAGHPYANSVSGTIQSVSGFKAADLRVYHTSLMQTSRMLLVVVGDVSADELKSSVEKSFGGLPRGNYVEKPLPLLDFGKPTVDVTPRSIQINYVQGAFAAPSLSNPDYFAMRVAINILQQLVFEEVRVRRQLSYAPSASLNNYAANTGTIYVTSGDANQSVSVMLEQVKLLRTALIREEFISGLAGQFLTQYFIGQETNAAQAGELARYELIGGGWRKSFEFMDRIREVRPKDVQAVSDKYMRNLRFVVVGNPQAVDKNIFLQD